LDYLHRCILFQGNSQRQIANILHVSNGTVGYDQIFLRQKAKENIKKYIDERLPDEYERCLIGINSILREAWNTSKQENIDNKEKIQVLSLAKECYSMKLDLLTNATVVSDTIKFVTEKSKLFSSLYNRESNNSGHNKNDECSKEANGKEETTNQVF
jgi:hypothetical protein